MRVLIGTAGWSIPRAVADAFPGTGSHLERYAAILPAAEINSSFHRPHRRATYERWAASTPESFRFSAKLPKDISHVRKLVGVEEPLDVFVEQVGGLGGKLGVVLLQTAPSLQFDRAIAAELFTALGRRLPAETAIACEPRHATWFSEDAEACLSEHRVARVAADPVLVPGAELPGGWPGLCYRRLHGSPRVYYSSYDADRLETVADAIRPGNGSPAEQWCIFDNTASGAAAQDALRLRSLIEQR